MSNVIQHQAISRKELAKRCGFSVKTLNRKLKQQGLSIPSGYINPENQELILKLLGFKSKNRKL